MRGVYRVLLGKPLGKRPLGIPRRRCVDNFRVDLWGEVVCSVLFRNRRERDHWGDVGVDGWIILEWICWVTLVYRTLVG